MSWHDYTLTCRLQTWSALSSTTNHCQVPFAKSLADPPKRQSNSPGAYPHGSWKGSSSCFEVVEFRVICSLIKSSCACHQAHIYLQCQHRQGQDILLGIMAVLTARQKKVLRAAEDLVEVEVLSFTCLSYFARLRLSNSLKSFESLSFSMVRGLWCRLTVWSAEHSRSISPGTSCILQLSVFWKAVWLLFEILNIESCLAQTTICKWISYWSQWLGQFLDFFLFEALACRA